jgi:hypothetical protein
VLKPEELYHMESPELEVTLLPNSKMEAIFVLKWFQNFLKLSLLLLLDQRKKLSKSPPPLTIMTEEPN